MSEIQPSNSDAAPPPVEPSLPVPVPVTAAPAIPSTAAAPAAASRPTGISIIAILAFIQGFLGICGACVVLGPSGLIAVIPAGVTQVVGGIGLFLGVLLAIGPVLQLLFAYGAWNLRSWAWLLGLIATGITVAGVVISIIGSGGATIWTAVTSALLSIIIFVYLLLPGTRKAFNM